MGFGGMKLEGLKEEDRRQAKLPPDRMALKVIHVGEYGEHAMAKRAGFQKGDIVVSFDGKDDMTTESDLLAYALQQETPRRQNSGDCHSCRRPKKHVVHPAMIGRG